MADLSLPEGYSLAPQNQPAPTLPEGFDLAPEGIGPAEVKEGMPSGLTNLLYGVRQPLDMTAAMLAKATGWGESDVAKANQEAAQAYQQTRMSGPIGTGLELAGNTLGASLLAAPVTATLPAATGAGLLPAASRLAANVIPGVVSGATEPVDPKDPDYWRKVGTNALVGGGIGAATPLALGAASRVVSPNVSPAVQALQQADVDMTPGLLAGGAANRFEQAVANSIPVVGDFIKNARRGAIVDFNRGAVNQALNPIGETLEATPGTHAAIAEMNTKIDNAYNTLKPQLGWTTDSPASAQLQADMSRLRANVDLSFPKKYADEFKTDIDLLVNARLSPGGGITGDSFKEAVSDLRNSAVDKTGSINSTAWDKRLGGAYMQAKQLMSSAQALADPEAASKLRTIDNSYATALRVSHAAGALGGEPGLFTPAQLQSSTKHFDDSLRDRAFSQGQALVQPYAEAGKSVLGSTLPNSGTPFQHLVQYGVLGGLLGHGLGLSPLALTGMGGLAGITGLAYSPPALRAINWAAQARPGLQPLAQTIRRGAPLVSAAIPQIVGSPLNQ